MKKILIIIFIFFFLHAKTEAAITVQSAGSTVVSATQISQPINVIISGLLNLLVTIKVKALDSYITNTTDSSLRIPVSQLYLNDGSNSYQMQNNIDVTILSALISVATYTKPYTALVTNVSAIPAGTYNTRLQFTLDSTLSTQTFTFTLSFVIPLDQSVSTTTTPVMITLTPENVFDTSANIANTTSPQINIKSNKKWKLLMDTSNLGTLIGNYYFQVLSATSHVNEYSTTPVKIEPNQQYTLAKGTGTYTAPITGSYTTDYILLKYYLVNNSGTFLKEGTYNNYVKYILQEDN
ncbi:MAG: hypothetical protein ACLSA2_08170 [Candidatus Gastranaerophilaceae bacterium]